VLSTDLACFDVCVGNAALWAMKVWGKIQVFHTFITVELDGGDWPVSSCNHFLPVKRAHGPQFFFSEVRNHVADQNASKCLGHFYLLFIYCLSNDAARSLDYVVSNVKMDSG
jgi:hypothetical protein